MSSFQNEIAATILHQLGGRQFIAMTGSSNFLADDKSLRMNLAKNNSGANILFIELLPSDTYKMTFAKFRKLELTIVQEFVGIYADSLQAIFTQVTGMETKLY